MKVPILARLLPLMALAVGCQGLQNGDMAWVQTHSEERNAGNAYLVRGLIGVFSTGMDELSTKINYNGVRAKVFQDAQEHALADQIVAKYKNAPNHEPLVLIGHSYGADDVVRVSRKLNEHGIKVDLMITVDATTPPKVPGNVAVCYNYYQSNFADGVPMFRGIPLTLEPGAKTVLHNVNVRDRTELLESGTNHINIDKNARVHQVILQSVLEACPPRQTWLASRGLPPAQQASGTVAPTTQKSPTQSPSVSAAPQARIAN